MIKLLGISGSLRAGSFNTALLRVAQQEVGDGVVLDVTTLHGIPLYDGDLEASNGVPEAVQQLKMRIRASDGVILSTPEYNNGIPGVFKNAIDWLSRPANEIESVFGNRPFTLMGASPGGFGTILSQNHWLPVLKTLGVRAWFGGRLLLSRAGDAFDGDGHLKDDKQRAQVRSFLHGFAQFVEGR